MHKIFILNSNILVFLKTATPSMNHQNGMKFISITTCISTNKRLNKKKKSITRPKSEFGEANTICNRCCYRIKQILNLYMMKSIPECLYPNSKFSCISYGTNATSETPIDEVPDIFNRQDISG